MSKPKNPNRIQYAMSHVPSVAAAPKNLKGRSKTCLGLSRDINKHLPANMRPHQPTSVMKLGKLLGWFRKKHVPEYIVETHPMSRSLANAQAKGKFIGLTTPTGTIRRNPEWKG